MSDACACDLPAADRYISLRAVAGSDGFCHISATMVKY